MDPTWIIPNPSLGTPSPSPRSMKPFIPLRTALRVAEATERLQTTGPIRCGQSPPKSILPHAEGTAAGPDGPHLSSARPCLRPAAGVDRGHCHRETIVVVTRSSDSVQEKKASPPGSPAKHAGAHRPVLREGEGVHSPASELVPGRHCSSSGTATWSPRGAGGVDLRLVDARESMVQEASLTGESVPFRKRMRMYCWLSALPPWGTGARCSTPPPLSTYGRATGVVVGHRHGTQVGNIADLLAIRTNWTPPSSGKLNAVGKSLTVIGLIVLCPDLPSRCPVPPAFDSTVPGGHLSGHLHHP